jgi:hypothetical protein
MIILLSTWFCLMNTFEARLERELLSALAHAESSDQHGTLRKIEMPTLQTDVEAILSRAGTNAIPILVRWIEDSGKSVPAVRIQAQKLGLRYQVHSPAFWRWAAQADRHQRAFLAAKGISALRPAADLWVPRLREIAAKKAAAGALAGEALDRMGFSR